MDRFDIIIFGASGFTGKYAVENMVKLCVKEEYRELRWAIAGRNLSKLQALLQEVKENKTDFDVNNIPLVKADIEDVDSLRAMTEQTKVLLNCTGPYTILGESVVKACLKTKTHYIDITAEAYFMIKLYKEYNKLAEEENTLIITGCGYASIPGDMGLVHLDKEFKGTLQTVECYTQLHIPRRAYLPGRDTTLVHYGTWASLVYELHNFRKKVELKNQMFPEISKNVPIPEKGFFHKRKGKCWFPYPGPDQDVVDLSQEHLTKIRSRNRTHFRIYTTMPKIYHMILIIPVFLFYYYACFMKCFRKLLWKFPRFFTLGYMSHRGPSRAIMDDTDFDFTFIGRGVDENQEQKSLVTQVSGTNPYWITAFVFVMSGITLIKDGSNVPRGGVLTSGAVFYDTNLIRRLNDNGLNFRTLDEIKE